MLLEVWVRMGDDLIMSDILIYFEHWIFLNNYSSPCLIFDHHMFVHVATILSFLSSSLGSHKTFSSQRENRWHKRWSGKVHHPSFLVSKVVSTYAWVLKRYQTMQMYYVTFKDFLKKKNAHPTKWRESFLGHSVSRT